MTFIFYIQTIKSHCSQQQWGFMKMKWDCKGYHAQAKEIFDDEAFTMLIENDCNPLTTMHYLFAPTNIISAGLMYVIQMFWYLLSQWNKSIRWYGHLWGRIFHS